MKEQDRFDAIQYLSGAICNLSSAAGTQSLVRAVSEIQGAMDSLNIDRIVTGESPILIAKRATARTNKGGEA